MTDLRHRGMRNQLDAVKRRLRAERKVRLRLPASFSFNRRGEKNFNPVVNFFDWTLKDQPVEIDFTGCASANYQALTLLVPYCWHLKKAGCTISFKFDKKTGQSASYMWSMMGGHGVFSVATDSTVNFKSTDVKPLMAVRNPVDLKSGLDRAEAFVGNFGIEYQRTLRYVLAELLYNAREHGGTFFEWRGKSFSTPAIFELSWYESSNEIGVLVADIGIGVRAHLSQAYPMLSADEEALRLAIQPEISGTFMRQDPYTDRNNAGMGLYISSSIVRRLHANMWLVSGKSALHISPKDLTSAKLDNSWNGTFVLLTIRLDQSYRFALDQMMQEAREAARAEVSVRQSEAAEHRHYVHVYNFFGTHAEDKDAAIGYRKKYLIAAVDRGDVIHLDFEGVQSATHSFLNALVASPIRRMGMQAYKRIKITNAQSDIRETIDYVLDDNTSGTGADPTNYELDV